MKKLLLILILLLSFTLIGNCAWLGSAGEWDYRIELAINDYAGKINGSVTWFPAEVFLTATQAEEVFAELTNDIEYKKIQFTQADGTSLLYGHMKVFDVAGTKGIFTVSATGWTIDANTSIFLYYDKDHADNNTYIGAINTSACENVYNPQYKAVYTMADGADNEHIYDATSNNNDGTKSAAGQPAEIAGKIHKGQDFDGVNDFIDSFANLVIGSGDSFTITAICKTDGTTAGRIFGYNGTGNESFVVKVPEVNVARFLIRNIGNDWTEAIGTTTINDNVYYLITATYDADSNRMDIYVNDTSEDNDTEASPKEFNSPIRIGAYSTPTIETYEDIIDEYYVSNICRIPAWIKGTYNSLWDTLFTYGSEETAPVVGITWNGVVITKWNGVAITIPINTQ